MLVLPHARFEQVGNRWVIDCAQAFGTAIQIASRSGAQAAGKPNYRWVAPKHLKQSGHPLRAKLTESLTACDVATGAVDFVHDDQHRLAVLYSWLGRLPKIGARSLWPATMSVHMDFSPTAMIREALNSRYDTALSSLEARTCHSWKIALD